MLPTSSLRSSLRLASSAAAAAGPLRRSTLSLAAPSRLAPAMAPALDAARSAPSALRANSTTVSANGGPRADPMTGEVVGLPDIDAAQLTIEKTTAPRTKPPSASLIFGHTFSDHMLSIPWNSASGWSNPRIHPYAPLQLDPSSVVFHYAPALFEGMKAYKDVNGKLRLFRPDMNMKRMNSSAYRNALPQFNGQELVKLISKLIQLDAEWIPSEPGYSLYIRPTLIGTQAALGVHPTADALLFVITTPVGPYYKTGFKPVALEADPTRVRAWPGGTGNYKIAGNYAPGIRPQMDAAAKGYQQNLWLFGEEHWLTEVGTMNLFVALNKGDHVELVTPPLNGMILPGVTRDSILSLARDHASGASVLDGVPSKLVVSEREMNMAEVQKCAADGSLLEMFGAGTAVVVSPVERVGYLGKDITIPTGPDGAGPIAKAMLKRITDIQLGNVDHPWSVVADTIA